MKAIERKKKLAAGEIDYPDQVRVAIPYKPGYYDLVWVKIQTGTKNEGTGALTQPVRHNPKLTMGTVIRYKRDPRDPVFAAYVPGRIHQKNTLAEFLDGLASDLARTMTFNPKAQY